MRFPIIALGQIIAPVQWKPARTCLVGLILLLSLSSATVLAGDGIAQAGIPETGSSWDDSIEDFVAEYCRGCHDSDTGDALFDFEQLGRDLSKPADFAKWERAYDRVRGGEMPPKDAERPPDARQERFLETLHRALSKAHGDRQGSAQRRLNRREYENTLNDLFGTRLSLAQILPEDGRTQEFDNVGEGLSISLEQMQAYIDAAELVLADAIADRVEPLPATTIRASYSESREGQKFIGKQWLGLDDGSVVFFRRLGYPTGMLRDASVRRSGFYKVRVNGYAYQSEQPITFSVGATTFQRGAPRPTYGYFEFPPGEPTTVELEAWIDERYMIQVEPYGISDDYAIKRNGVENYGGPGLAIRWIEVEGPIVKEFPSRGHRLVLDGFDRREIEPARAADKNKSWYKPKFEIVSDNLQEALTNSLLRVAKVAFRRDVSESDIDAYRRLFDRQREDGAGIEESLRTSVTAMLCSPDFLFFREPRGPLDDHAIATRLAYFLTRTTPDAELIDAAQRKSLVGNPAVLREQTERLLRDPRFRRFVVDFTDSWLDLRQIDFTNPDKTLFPEYDPFLRFSMPEETRAFLQRLVQENLPISNLIQSDFAMLNRRLAEHYQIDGVAHPELRVVRLPEGSLRGGLLSQASILKVSANGTNTSPVVRGVWVTERILGQTPPPPPEGISGVEPDIRGATTLRELLEKHRDNDTCRSCHRTLDPPGFALESFDPIGGFRQRFRSLGSGDKVTKVVHGDKVRYRLGQPVDASGEFANGKKFAGYREFRDELARQPDTLTRALATKLLTFATGREMGFSDRQEIDRIVRESRATGYGIGELFHLIVQSNLFLNK